MPRPTCHPTCRETAAQLRWLPDLSLESAAAELRTAASSLPVWLASVLRNRGLTDEGRRLAFLNPHPDALHDPSQMRGMQRGVDRILQAILHGKPSSFTAITTWTARSPPSC